MILEFMILNLFILIVMFVKLYLDVYFIKFFWWKLIILIILNIK